MAFHENFWVVTGAAGPVIALAAIISAGDADEQVNRMAEAVVKLSEASQKNYRDTLQVLEKVGVGNLLMIAKVQYVNVVMQAALLALSLGSIASQRNLISPGWAGVLPVVGILLLALGGARTVGVRQYSRPFLNAAQEAEKQAGPRAVSAEELLERGDRGDEPDPAADA